MFRSRLLSGLAVGVAAAATASFAALAGGPADAQAVAQANGVAYGTGSTVTLSSGTATLEPGSGAGSSAQVQVVRPGQPSAATPPTFTSTPPYGGGNPRWVIQFHNGCWIFGSPPVRSTTGSDLLWSERPGGATNVSWAQALGWADGTASGSTCGQDNSVIAAFILTDSSAAGIQHTLTNITYNGLPVVPDTAPPAESSTGRIRNVHSGRCLDVAEGRYQVGAHLQQWACGAAGGAHQNFRIVRRADGTGYLLAISPTGQLFAVTTNGQGSPLTLTTARANMTKTGSAYRFPNPAAGELAMDVRGASTANGAGVIGWPHHAAANQQWSNP